MNIKRALSRADFDKFRQYIESRTGIYIDDSKQTSFKISLDTRMHITGMKDYGAYYSLITADAMGQKEFTELLNLVLIKETFFFRDDTQLRALTRNILPELKERKKGNEIKIWSAGCSTGEEPYSIAMAILENFPPGSINVSIYATDISPESLARAKEGIYGKNAMRAIDRTALNRYFIQREGQYYINDQIKQLVRFDTLNLTGLMFHPIGDSFDIVFCKNVLIYFRQETVKTVIRKLYNILTPGGYLFLGHSESLWQISDEFELEEISGVFLYRKNRKTDAVVPSTKWLTQTQMTGQGYGIRDQKTVVKTKTPFTAPRPAVAEKKPATKRSFFGKRDISELIKKDLHPPADVDYDSILENIEETLLDDPGNVNAHLLAGKIYANMGLYDKALKKGEDVLGINDLCAEAYMLMGSIYYKTGKREMAVSAFKKAVYLDDKSVLSHYYLGNLYKDAHLSEEAIREYKNAIIISDTHAELKESLVGEVFTVNQLKELCIKNIEILSKEKYTAGNIK